jgi:hypothetical protein
MPQLDWYLEKNMYGGLRADCPQGGFYRIRPPDDGYTVTGHRLGGKRNMIFIGDKPFSSLDEAKAAAQADLSRVMEIAKRTDETEDEKKFWQKFWQLPREEAVRMIQQTMDDHPETWVRDSQGRYTLRNREDPDWRKKLS